MSILHGNMDFPYIGLEDIEGTVFDIQDYSIHDGPGIRTVVFLKGCPLNCLWCSNPESQSPRPELGVALNRCTGCGRCIEVCPAHAVSMSPDGGMLFERSACIVCGKCAVVCNQGVRKVFGKPMSVTEVVREIMRSAPFYTRSGGGVTISGGEPLLQFEFLRALLFRCRQKYLHTAVETCGYVRDRKMLEEIAASVDLFLYDIKCIDNERHRRFTGVSNRVILENAQFISEIEKDLVVRVPVIPGFNDNVEAMQGIADFAKTLDSLIEVDLLPFHGLGKFKYDMLDREFQYGAESAPEPEQVDLFRDVFSKRGIPCRID